MPTTARRSPRRRRPSPSSSPATLRAAGVRIAFTVPGESFLAGARRARGRRDPDRRDPPRGCGRVRGRGLRPADRAVPPSASGRARSAPRTSAIGIHTATADSTPMFVLVGQVDRAPPRPRGVPGGRPRRDDRGARQVGGRDRRPGDRRGHARGRRPRHRRGSARAGAPRACPRTSSTCRCPRATRTPVVRSHPERARPVDDVRAVLALPRRGRAARDPRRRRRPASALLERPRAVRGAAPRARHRELAAGRRHPQRPPAVPRHGRLRRAAGRARAARDRRRAARHRLAAQRAHDVRLRDPGSRPALDARRPRAPDGRGRVRRAARRSRSAPTRGRSSGRPTRGSRRRSSSRRRSPRATRTTLPTGPRGRRRPSSTPTTGSGPGVHPGRIIADAAPAAPRRRHPDHGRRRLRRLGRRGASGSGGPGTFLGPTSGAMGYGLPGGARGRARPSRAARRRAASATAAWG